MKFLQIAKIIFSTFLLVITASLQAQNITQEGSKKIFSVANEQEFRSAIAQAQDGDEIRLTSDITIYPQQNDSNGHALPFTINKEITIEGQGRRLSFTRGLPIETLKSVTFRNMNLDMLPESGVNASYIYASNNTLIFDNVTTKVQGQSEEVRPTIVAGTYQNSSSSGTHARIIIRNIGRDAGAFHKIIAGNRNSPKTTPTSIEIEAPIKVREGILLGNENGQMSGNVSVVSKSSNITKYQGNTTGESSVKLEGVSASNLLATNITNLELVRSNITPQNYGISVKNILTIDQNSTLNLTNFDEDLTLAGVLKGEGEIEISNEIAVTITNSVVDKTIIRLDGFSFTEQDVKRALQENGQPSQNVVYIWKNERYTINQRGELVKEEQVLVGDNSDDEDPWFIDGGDEGDDDDDDFGNDDEGFGQGDDNQPDGTNPPSTDGENAGTDTENQPDNTNPPSTDGGNAGTETENQPDGTNPPSTNGENAGTDTENQPDNTNPPSTDGGNAGTDTENQPDNTNPPSTNGENAGTDTENQPDNTNPPSTETENQPDGTNPPSTDGENAGTNTENQPDNTNPPNTDGENAGTNTENQPNGTNPPSTNGENAGTDTENQPDNTNPPSTNGENAGTDTENQPDNTNPPSTETENQPDGTNPPSTNGGNAGTDTENQPDNTNPPSTDGGNAGTETENQPDNTNPPSTDGENAGTETENQPDNTNPPSTDGENAGTDTENQPNGTNPPSTDEKALDNEIKITNYLNKKSDRNNYLYIQGVFETGELLIFNELGQKVHHEKAIRPVQKFGVGMPLKETPVELNKLTRGVYFYIFNYKTNEENHKKTGFLYVL